MPLPDRLQRLMIASSSVRPHANGDQSFPYLRPEEQSPQSLANIAHVPTP